MLISQGPLCSYIYLLQDMPILLPHKCWFGCTSGMAGQADRVAQLEVKLLRYNIHIHWLLQRKVHLSITLPTYVKYNR
jgi:hypothetical protein